jgi:hypothetical protein
LCSGNHICQRTRSITQHTVAHPLVESVTYRAMALLLNMRGDRERMSVVVLLPPRTSVQCSGRIVSSAGSTYRAATLSGRVAWEGIGRPSRCSAIS